MAHILQQRQREHLEQVGALIVVGSGKGELASRR